MLRSLRISPFSIACFKFRVASVRVATLMMKSAFWRALAMAATDSKGRLQSVGSMNTRDRPLEARGDRIVARRTESL